MKIADLRHTIALAFLSLSALAGIAGCALFNSPPVADFTFAISWRFVPGQVHFDASASHDVDDPIAEYAWDFGDGSRGNGEFVSHSYTTSGAFLASLTVTDSRGKADKTSQSLSILPSYELPSPPVVVPPDEPPNNAPVASFSNPLRFESTYPQESTQSFSSVACVFMEYSGAERFSVVLLDGWHQRAVQLANASGPFEGHVERPGGGQGPPYCLDIDAVGEWAITVFTSWEADDPPQTYVGCSSGRLAQYSPFFYLMPGQATFYFDSADIALLDYARGDEVPLSREVNVLGGAYLLKIKGGGCWEVSVEQVQ